MTTETKVKCPGWHHEYDKDACEVDRKIYAWLSSRQETTIKEREKQRQDQHARAGLFETEVDF